MSSKLNHNGSIVIIESLFDVDGTEEEEEDRGDNGTSIDPTLFSTYPSKEAALAAASAATLLMDFGDMRVAAESLRHKRAAL